MTISRRRDERRCHDCTLFTAKWRSRQSGDEPADCVLPSDHGFDPVLDSTAPDGTPADTTPLDAGATIVLPPRSVRLLRSR